MDTVWKDVFVTPNVLTRAIAQMRKALGDDARDSKYIETVSKLGYRFIAPVTVTGIDTPALAVAPSPAPPVPQLPVIVERPRAASPPWARLGVAALLLVIAGSAVAWFAMRHRIDRPVSAPLIQRLTSSGDVTDAAISRDGRFLAYVRSEGGQQSLWVRQINSANALQIVPPSSVGYWGITFAPDGNFVYYALKGPLTLVDAGGTLFKAPVLPGTPQRLLAGIDSHVTFAPDAKRLAFIRIEPDGSGSSSLMIADVDGGNLRALSTYHPPVFLAPRFFAAPSWSPDSARISAPLTDRKTGESRLVAIDVADGSEHVVQSGLASIGYTSWMPDGSGIVYSGSEHLRFAAGGGAGIWHSPYPRGTPRRITADPIEYRNASVSSDGKAIVSVGQDPISELWLAPVQGGEARRLPSVRYDGIAGAGWLGPRLVFTSYDSGAPQIWTMSLDGSDRKQLTTEGWNAWPAATSDGRTIYFVSTRSGAAAIWRMDADGRGARELFRAADAWNVTMTRDDQWLIFNGTVDSQPATWKMPVAGGEPTLVARGLTRAAASPDGRSIAGIVQRQSTGLELAVVPLDGGAPTHRFTPMPLTTTGAGAVGWTQDGQAVLFTSAERMNIWKQPLSGGPPARVTAFQDGAVYGFRVSPDFRQFVLAHGSNTRDAFLITGF